MWAVIMKVTFLLHWISLRLRKLILTYNPSYCEGTVKSKFEEFGVRVDGDRPCDLRVYDSRFFREVAHDTAMGLAEAYMHGYWVPNNFSAFFDTILKNGDDIFNAKHGRQLWKAVVSNVFHSLTGKIFRVKPEPTTHFSNVHKKILKTVFITNRPQLEFFFFQTRTFTKPFSEAP